MLVVLRFLVLLQFGLQRFDRIGIHTQLQARAIEELLQIEFRMLAGSRVARKLKIQLIDLLIVFKEPIRGSGTKVAKQFATIGTFVAVIFQIDAVQFDQDVRMLLHVRTWYEKDADAARIEKDLRTGAAVEQA